MSSKAPTADVKPKKFTDRSTLLIDKNLDYPRNGDNPGRILIFNYEKSKSNDRPGSKVDLHNLRHCFLRLGFNINYEEDICINYTATDVDRKLNQVLADKEGLQNANCLIVIFMTHGNANEEIEAADFNLKTEHVWGKFKDCQELREKPKMFIFQACKGDFYATTKGESELEKVPSRPRELVQMSYFEDKIGDDMLIVYSTCEDNVSHRREISGSWFIQELVTNFSKYGNRCDVITILLRVTKCVSTYFAPHSGPTHEDIAKQLPVFISTLSKKFYLIRSKEQHEKLVLLEKIQVLEKLISRSK